MTSVQQPVCIVIDTPEGEAISCEVQWESEPDPTGASVVLCEADDGTAYLCLTDRANGSAFGVSVSYESLIELNPALRYYLYGVEDEDPEDLEPEGLVHEED
jgi:hypothetical protein